MKFTFFVWAWMLCHALSLNAQVANSLNFDGNNDYVARSIFLSSNINITMEARIKLGGVSLPTTRYILSNGSGTTGVGIFLTPSNSVVIRSGASTYTTSYAVPVGSFVLLSVVFTPNLVNFYVNGVLTNTAVMMMAPAPTGSFWIGANGGSEFFAGDMDEVRIWNRAVCAQEITHRVNCSATGLEPQAAAIYKFNQGVAAGNNPTVTTLNDATPNMNHATLYNFTLTGTSSNWVNSSGAYAGNCSIAPLTLTISPTSATICSPGGSATLTASGAMSYTWNTGATGPAITATAAGVYSVLGMTGPQCYGMAMAGVTIAPNPTVTVNSASICPGQTAVLVASGATTYSWSTGATTSSIAVSPSLTTTYTVTGFNGSCSDTKTTVVNIVPSPTVSVSASHPTICSGQNTTLMASGASTYSWSSGHSTGTIVLSPPINTTFTVTGFNGACSDTKTITIHVIITPTVSISASSPTICAGSGASVVLTASGASTYSWNTGATTSSIVVTPSITTTYSVVGFNASCSHTQTYQVTVLNCSGIREIMSEAGVNIYPVPASDVLTVVMEEPSEVSVYNLVGQVVYRYFGKEVKVNTSTWSRGTYVVQIRNERGQSISRKFYLRD